MKELKLILGSMLSCLVLLWSCSEQDKIESSKSKTVELELSLEVINDIVEKSGALDGTTDLTDENLFEYCTNNELETGDEVNATYTVTYYNTAGAEVGSEVDQQWNWTIDLTATYANVSELRQFDFPEDAVTASIVFSDFRVKSSTGDLKLLTPKKESAFAGYVALPLDAKFDFDIYEKKYIKMEVLCFNEEDIPLFGFAWADFDIVSGDEVCLFFNCIGTTASSYHQVFAASFEAMYNTGTVDNPDWTTIYWEGMNYTDQGVPANIEPFCIPCPGNWKAMGGMQIAVTPMGYSEPLTVITITAEQIEAFLDINDEEAETPMTTNWSYDEYELSLDISEGMPFLHYTLDYCYKPTAFYSNTATENGTSDIYGVTMGDGNEIMVSKIFTTTENFEASLAMSTDETQLLMVNRYNPRVMVVYDLYSLVAKTLTLDAAGETVLQAGGKELYAFTQLVYIDGQLYAGCEANKCLVPITYDYDNGTFSFVTDIIEEATWYDQTENLRDGDLLVGTSENGHYLYNFTDYEGAWPFVWRQHKVIRYSNIYSGSDVNAETSYIGGNFIDGILDSYDLADLSGVCLVTLKDGSVGALTSQNNEGSLIVKVWGGTPSTLISSTTISDIAAGQGGDLASAFYSISYDEIESIFGFSSWDDINLGLGN